MMYLFDLIHEQGFIKGSTWNLSSHVRCDPHRGVVSLYITTSRTPYLSRLVR